MKRQGYGKGTGKGYKNLLSMDSHIHALSAKGVKSKGETPFGALLHAVGTEDNSYKFETQIDIDEDGINDYELEIPIGDDLQFQDEEIEEATIEPINADMVETPSKFKENFKRTTKSIGQNVSRFASFVKTKAEQEAIKHEEQKKFLEGLTESQLKELSIKETGFNDVYGREIIRRIKKRQRLNEKIKKTKIELKKPRKSLFEELI
jgi:hypothetical protein